MLITMIKWLIRKEAISVKSYMKKNLLCGELEY